MPSRTRPVVAIIGRPNVGKSCVFNRIVQKRKAVVDDTPGVTRDRQYMSATWNGCHFDLVDTGGLAPASSDRMAARIRSQVEVALEEALVVVFVVDAQTGPADEDMLIARSLRRLPREKLIVAANKAEGPEVLQQRNEFIRMGLGEVMPVSALHGQGVADMLDLIVTKLGGAEGGGPEDDGEIPLRITIVGRPNAGKSSITNRLIGQERMIVDDVPGTTRDSIDTELVYNGTRYTIIDTAGLRRKAQVHDDVEYFSNLRALDSIKRCDVAAVVIDAALGIGEQDLKIATKVHEDRKGLVVCWNKWDLVDKTTSSFDEIAAETRGKYLELRRVPMISMSAVTGQRLVKLLEAAEEVHERMTLRVGQTRLEDLVFEHIKATPHPPVAGKQIRILGAKQRNAAFPLFHIYATNAQKAQPSYARFIANKIQDEWDFGGCPVVVEFRQVARKGQKL